MVKIDQGLKEKKLEAKLIMQIHDELVFDVPAKEEAAAIEIIRRNMQESMELAVPLEVKIKVGKIGAE